MQNIKSTVEQLAKTAFSGCGLSHQLYVERFSSAIDRYTSSLNAADKDAVLREAEQHDYATNQEIMDAQSQLLDDGWCIHGIDPGCCSAGCGEF